MHQTALQTLTATAVACVLAIPASTQAQTAAPSSTTHNSTAATQAATPVSTPIPVIDLKPADGKLGAQVTAQLKKAAAAGQAPFIEIGATWCGPCKRLAASLGDSLMIDAFKGTYIVHLDADAWKDDLASLGLDSKAIPVFFALDSLGHASGPRIDGGAWGDDIPVNMAPPLKKFFSEHLKPSEGTKQ